MPEALTEALTELLRPHEYTVAGLMADLPMQRAARNQIRVQLSVLQEGLTRSDNPAQSSSPQMLYTVGDFETLPIVSTRIWGIPDYWQQLAITNNLVYPYTIVPGQRLRIPTINAR